MFYELLSNSVRFWSKNLLALKFGIKFIIYDISII